MWTARYRMVPLKINRRLPIEGESTVGGRLREIGDRLREIGDQRKREEEEEEEKKRRRNITSTVAARRSPARCCRPHPRRFFFRAGRCSGEKDRGGVAVPYPRARERSRRRYPFS
ncbi:hypothetical protein B296_00052511 [Ensete ventricosum]|uniref:Uncharacterized protein n=1 Tax=Ensete ventricosum TaxID=4639 RepID=A0A426YC23_ENSVE|nr:hypothetical protein B296_00052511 [Ensete ventricosum]